MTQRVHLDANREARRLLQTAEVVRRYAGSLRYHPLTGLATPPGPEVTAAVGHLQESLDRIGEWLPVLAQNAADLDRGDMISTAIRTGAARLERLSGLLRAALDVFTRLLVHPERASLDAPYGLGAPRRTHPGAQATWVAERAEALAQELAAQAVLRENLAVETPRTTR